MQLRNALVLALAPLGGCGGLGYYGPPGGTDAPEDTSDPLGTVIGDDDDDVTVPPPTEICDNGIDDDADTATDCNDSDCFTICDGDDDGERGVAFGGPDCDDTDPDVNTAGIEICDGIDNDCFGGVDDDQDGDGSDACDDCDDANPAIRPGAAEICNDGIDQDCSGDDCTDFVADFETGAIGAPWTPTGAGPWFATSAASHGGSWGAQSRVITHSQTTGMQVVLDFPSGGNLEFWHTGSSESSYDYLRFFMDGVERASWSGVWAWQQSTWSIPAGTHTFEWRYTKDGSINSGLDAAVVDDITAYGGSP